MCDMFAGKCFNYILRNETTEQKCSTQCLQDCQEIQYNVIPTFIPLNTDNLCRDNDFFEPFFKSRVWKFEFFDDFPLKNTCPDDEVYFKICQEYIRKYISIVVVDTPLKGVLKSRREVRVDFTDRLAMFGGTLGLFTGMSILSMIEVVCLVIKLLKKSVIEVSQGIIKK